MRVSFGPFASEGVKSLTQLGKLGVQVVAADFKEDARSNATPSRPAIAISGGEG